MPVITNDEVECPICGYIGDSFIPAGIKQMVPDRRCPTCTGLERHRTVWLYFRERTNLFTEAHRMLHIAPEPSFRPRLKAAPNLRYLTADLLDETVDVKLDLEHIQYPDWYFDVVYASHVLEHVADDRQAIREIFRVLRPGGWALLVVPIFGAQTREDVIDDPAERERLYGQTDHVRMYGHDGVFPDRLSEAGFRVTIEPYAKAIPYALKRRYRLVDEDIIFYCEKGQNLQAT
jgi:SAM-dependent methyltransferase